MGAVYPWLKHFHVACAGISIAGFLLRGWMTFGRCRSLPPWSARARDVVDGLLLSSGVGLVLLTGQYPAAHSWLTAKLLALVTYVFLGILAFRLPRQGWPARTAWGAALVVAMYMVSVALEKTPMGFLPLIGEFL